MTSLRELTEAFLSHQRALGRAAGTVRHYEDSLRLLLRCCLATGIEPVAANLTTATMTRFAAWLRETPTRPWRGKTERSVWGVHGALKDTKIWLTWLVEQLPKVPIPRLPRTLYPILTDDELEQVLASAPSRAAANRPSVTGPWWRSCSTPPYACRRSPA